MTDEPVSTIERPKRLTRWRLAAIVGIVAIPGVWIGWEMLDDAPCDCGDTPPIDRRPAP